MLGALKKLPWRGKPQARPLRRDRPPAVATGSPFGEVLYLTSAHRFSSGTHLGRAKMLSQLSHHTTAAGSYWEPPCEGPGGREGRGPGRGRARTRDLRLSGTARQPADPNTPRDTTPPPAAACHHFRKHRSS